VALTEAKKKNLEDKDFHNLYTRHREKWAALAKKSRSYAKKNITGGADPRPDDVAKILYPIVEVDADFRGHQEDNKARQSRFIGWFTEYIIDQAL
jgi:hypothetical protein